MTMSSRGLAAFVTWMCALSLAAAPLAGQTREEGPWWPHPIWGPDDQAGASNWITPEKILEAMSLVETGQVYELGYPYERGMPLLGTRSYASFLVPAPPGRVGALLFNDDYLAAEIGQVGTQFDGLGHVGRRIRMADSTVAEVFYNGFTLDEMRSTYGLLALGVEHVKPYLTRGVLIDVAGYRGVESLPNGYDARLSDIRGALDAQGLTEGDIRAGDAILINLGWSDLWAEPERVANDWGDRPGVQREVLDWLVERQPSLVGWDTAAGGVGHVVLTTYNGIPSLELMNLRELSADNVYEFMFVFTPVRFSGATGSPGRPLAIR